VKKTDLIEIWTCQGGNCFYCHRPMSWTPGSYATSFTKDHFYPKVNGNGLNGNTVLCHEKCNQDKKARMPNRIEKEQFKKLYQKINNRREKLQKMKEEINHRARINNRKKAQVNLGKW